MDESFLGLACVLFFILVIYLEFRGIENKLNAIHEEIKKLKKY